MMPCRAPKIAAFVAYFVPFVLAEPLLAIEQRKAPPSFGSSVKLPHGLRGSIYNLKENTTYLPDLQKDEPIGSVYTYTLNVPERSFYEGFPGVTHRIEWFAIDYEGDIWIRNAGKYQFTLASDDGSRLYIDDKLIIDNDGVHATVTLAGKANLEEGRHHLRVAYFQGPRYSVALVLQVAAPGEKYKPFDMRDFLPPMAANAAAVTDPDVPAPTLRRRTTALLAETTEQAEQTALAALKASPLPHAFDVRFRAFRFRQDDAGSQYALAFEVPAVALKVRPEPEIQRNKLHVSLFALLKDSSGQVVDRIYEDAPIEVADQQLPSVRSNTITLQRPERLPAGKYTVETVVVDREGDQMSAGVFSFENPAPAPLGLSDVVLVKRVVTANIKADDSDPFQFQGKRVIPELAPATTAENDPYVYFVVYPDKTRAEKPVIGVQLIRDGVVLANQNGLLPDPDRTGAIPMTIAAVKDPGKYELRIRAIQGAASVEHNIQYAVLAK